MEFSSPIVGASDELVRNGIQSRGFQSGVTGWRIDRNGNAEFNAVTLRGKLVSTNGSDTVIVNNTPNPRVEFYKSGYAEPATIVGYKAGPGTGTPGVQIMSAQTAGHQVNTQQTDEFGWRTFNIANAYNNLGVVDGTHGVEHFTNAGIGTWLPLLVKGKVGTGTTTTAISNSTDTNISGANLVNVPVVDSRAYLVMVQLDYFRNSTGVLDRFQVKLWDGAVGGTQLGGTARIGMSGGLNTKRRPFTAFFVFQNFLGDRTIANMNLSMRSDDTTASADWTAEFNAAYVALCFEIGEPTIISNL